MTESLAQQIKAKRTKINGPITDILQSSTHARHKLQSTICSRVSEYSTAVEFLVLLNGNVQTCLPSTSVDVSSWEIPDGIQLADPSFHDTRPVQLVLGAEIFFDLFKVPGRIQLGESQPNLVNSVLGWVVSGGIPNCRPTSVTANVTIVADLHCVMEKFWTIEETNESSNYSVEEAACEAHFRRTVSRSPEGRYIVRPLKSEVLATLGDNRRSALRRFHLIENRLSRNPELAGQYREFMQDYEVLGHMQLVHYYETPPSPTYHLPHDYLDVVAWAAVVLAFELRVECVLAIISASGVWNVHVDYAEVEESALDFQLAHSFVVTNQSRASAYRSSRCKLFIARRCCRSSGRWYDYH